MKILLMVLFALTIYVHCEETEESSDKYTFGKNNEIHQSSTINFHSVKGSNNEGSSSHKRYYEGLNTIQNTPNSQGQFVAIPKAQSYQYIKNLPITYQLQQNPSYGYNVPASESYKVVYKSYPQTMKTFDNVPVKQSVATQLTDFANMPQSNYLASNQMVAPKESKHFVVSPQIYERTNAGFGSNGYGSSQYRFAEQYSYKPATWTEVSNGVKIGAPRTYVSNEYRNPKIPYGNEFKYTTVARSAQYIKPEYNPAVVREYGPGIFNEAFTTKSPELIPYAKQQYMYVVPKEYASIPSESHGYNRQNFGNSFTYIPKSINGYSDEYSSVPSFKSSLREIVKMVNEEQRKSNGKAIFLIGKPQFPLHMLTNTNEYSAPSTQFGSNINALNSYKY